MMNFAHGGGWGSNGFGHMGMRGFGGFGSGIIGWIMMLLFAGLIVTGIVYLIKNMKNDSNNDQRYNNDRRYNDYQQIDYKGAAGEDSARKIARERYAKGEIDKEELKEILTNLKQ